MYPDDRVTRIVSENFIPARVHVKDQPEDYRRLGERYKVQWTPTLLIVDPEGTERHRIEGFLPAEDLVAQLLLGLGHSAFARQNWADAERRFRDIVAALPNGEAAPEALYWAGVSRYKGSGDPSALAETGRAFTQKYRDSSWAKKASVWAS